MNETTEKEPPPTLRQVQEKTQRLAEMNGWLGCIIWLLMTDRITLEQSYEAQAAMELELGTREAGKELLG